MSSNLTTYHFPTSIDYGVGSRKKISKSLNDLNLKKPLIVTDRGVVVLPWFQIFVEDLKNENHPVNVFSEIWGNPVTSQVLAGVKVAKAHQTDAVISIGGGAALDVAKLIALMLHHPGDLYDYEDSKPDGRPVDQHIPYLIALPSTAGTGSEVGRSAVVSDDETKIKKIIFSPRLLPQKVYLDPEILIGLPPHITAATGMDALTHCIEAYLSKGFHPICDGIALEGLRIISNHLKASCDFAKSKTGATPDHLRARGMMLNAAMMGATAFQKGLGATHSFAHALSTVCDLHHGLANGIMLPYIMKFNLEASPERFKIMATTIGLKDGHAFIDWIEALNHAIDIPRSLSAVGVKSDHLKGLINCAFADPCHSLNPRSLDRDDFERIYLAALKN